MIQFILGKIRAVFQLIRELGKIAPLAILTLVLPIFGAVSLLALVSSLSPWLRENQTAGAVLFVAGVSVFSGLAILPTNVLGMVSGWAFGFNFGLPLMITGICGAALISYLIGSRLAGDKIEQMLYSRPKAKAVYQALLGKSFWRTTFIIILLRLSPAMPFAISNFLMAAARVPLKSFLLGTLVGMLPRTSAVVFVGAGLSKLDFDESQESWLIIFGIISTIIVVVVISIISRQTLLRIMNSENSANFENSANSDNV